MAFKKKPKSEFGCNLGAFLNRTGLTAKQVAQETGVSYATLMDCTTGRSAGHELIPKVNAFIEAYGQNPNTLGNTGTRLT